MADTRTELQVLMDRLADALKAARPHTSMIGYIEVPRITAEGIARALVRLRDVEEAPRFYYGRDDFSSWREITKAQYDAGLGMPGFEGRCTTAPLTFKSSN